MPNVASVLKYFARAVENSVPLTLGGSILAGATTVPVNGMTNYNDGDVVVFVVDPGTPSLKQAFTGSKSGSNIINVVWTEVPTGGSNVPHASGATVVDYVTSSHWDMMTTGIGKSLNQDGSLITAAVQTALNITGGAAGGWTPTGFFPNTVAYNGNRSYTLTFNAHDLSTQLTPGMRLQMIRTVTAPTQCTSLNGTTQFYSKTSPAGMTFTDDFTVSTWIKLTSYAIADIVSRYNGTSGWELQLNASGQIALIGRNAGAANFSQVLSNQSVPLNKWVHIQANLDMSAFATNTDGGASGSTIAFDGVNVPSTVSRGGTNPTTLVQAGNLEVGSTNGGTNPLPGKIAQAAIYNSKITIANVVATISQGLAGTETSQISAYSFNGVITDLNANANNLTANGSAVATNADTPFTQTQTLTGFVNGTTNYGIVTSASFSTNTTAVVQVPEGDTIPTTGGVSAVSYATNKVPYGFPAAADKWDVVYIHKTQNNTGAVGSGVITNLISAQLSVPIGSWKLGFSVFTQITHAGAGGLQQAVSLSTSASAVSDAELTSNSPAVASAQTEMDAIQARQKNITVGAATPYFLITTSPVATTTQYFNGLTSATRITAECALL